MFRSMRRGRQQLSEAEAAEILRTAKTGVLGVIGDEGYPYTVPVNFVYTEGKIYFHGAKAGHKFDAMKRNDKVSFCVIEKDDVVKEEFTTYFRSVILFGRVRILETEEELYHAAEVLGLKYNSDPEAVKQAIAKEWAGLSCMEITIEHMTGKEAIELTRMRK